MTHPLAALIEDVPRYDPNWNRLLMRVAADGDYVEYDRILAALEAAPPMGAKEDAAKAHPLAALIAGVKVKLLEWVNGAAKDLYGDEYQVVLHDGGTYEIEHPRLFNSWHRFPTLDAAKAAAQADYEVRILAALEAATPPDLVEAGKVLERMKSVCTCNIDSTPCMSEDDCRDAIAAADTITALIALATAQQSQIAGLEGGIEAACRREAATERKLRAEAATLRDEVERLRGAGKDAADAWEECLGHVVAALGEKPDWYGHEAGLIADFRAALEGKA